MLVSETATTKQPVPMSEFRYYKDPRREKNTELCELRFSVPIYCAHTWPIWQSTICATIAFFSDQLISREKQFLHITQK